VAADPPQIPSAVTIGQSGSVDQGKEIAEYLGLRQGLVKSFKYLNGERALTETERTMVRGGEMWRIKRTTVSGQAVRDYKVGPMDVGLIGYQPAGGAYKQIDPPGTTLKWPLQTGTKWTNAAGTTLSISIEDVDTGAGTFFGCAKVADRAGSVWYCRGVGVVKAQFPASSGGWTGETLSDFAPRFADVRYRSNASTSETVEETRRQLAGTTSARTELADLFGKFSVRKSVTCAELWPNAFAFEGQKVALVDVYLKMMLDRNKALVGGPAGECLVVVSGVPDRTFPATVPGLLVLVGDVVGMTEVKLGGFAPSTVPHMRFSGVHFCKTNPCSQ
jgi:hypothetical protein